MTTAALAGILGLVLAQVWMYRVASRRALLKFWTLIFFYLLLFSFMEGLRLFCAFFSASFYELPFFLLIVFLVFGRTWRALPEFEKREKIAPNFYLLSGFWMGMIWFGFFQDQNILGASAWSLIAAILLPVLAGIRERLELLDIPRPFQGFPILAISAMILLLGFLFFNTF